MIAVTAKRRKKAIQEVIAPAVTAVKSAGNVITATLIVACVALVIAIMALTVSIRK
jgi:hypothetical protein